MHKKSIAMRLGACSLALAAAAHLHPASAQTSAPDAASVEDARKALRLRQADLKASEEKSQRLQNDISSLASERAKLKRRLIDTADLVKKSEAKLTESEKRLAGLEQQENKHRLDLATQRQKIGKLFATLQRMGRNPPPVIITRRQDALKMVRSAMLIARAFPELREDAKQLATKLQSLVKVMGDIRSENKKLAAETEKLKSTRIKLASLVEKRQRSISEREAELVEVRKATREMSTTVDNLNELISKITTEISKLARVKEHEEEAKRQIAAAEAAKAAAEKAKRAEAAKARNNQSEPKPANDERTVVAVAPPTIEPKAERTPSVTGPSPAVVLAPGGKSLVPGKTNRMKPAIAFALAKGKLPLPANGRRVLSFGDTTQYGGKSKGIVLETRYNAQITSPNDGWIVYAGEFRSYGQLLIINAGGGYHVLLAGMSSIDVKPGQFVLAAEPVGTMSGAPRTAQLKSTTAGTSAAQASVNLPVLYVEFRKNGQPTDPDPWWVKAN